MHYIANTLTNHTVIVTKHKGSKTVAPKMDKWFRFFWTVLVTVFSVAVIFCLLAPLCPCATLGDPVPTTMYYY